MGARVVAAYAYGMRDLIRVLIVGTGQMGSAIARVLLEKQGVEIVGACDSRSELTGADLGRVIGLERDLGTVIGSDLLGAIHQAQPDLAIQAAASQLEAVAPDIELLLCHGVSVISLAEEMAYPWYRSTAIAEKLHGLATANGAVVLGTGINPGFVLDLLIITLTGACARVETISASRSNDLSAYGETVLRAQGVGATPEAFARGVREGTVTGHLGFPESMHMIAAALGWRIDSIEQSREPIVSTVRRETPQIVIEPGQVAGCLHRAFAYRNGSPLITFDHPQQVRPELEGARTGDRIEIRGVPDIQIEGSPEIAGGQATAAIAVNMIPRVLSAAPGLHTMADLPVPAALHEDVRRFIHPAQARTDG